MSELASAPSGSARAGRSRPSRGPSTRRSPVRARRASPAAAARRPDPDRPTPDRPTGHRDHAGTLLAGRYRLRTRVGSDTAAGAEFWRAEDTVLQRDVGVTVLRRLAPGQRRRRTTTGPEPPGPARWWSARCARAASSTPAAPGCSTCWPRRRPGSPRDVLGAAVTEWVPGRSLAEVVADGMSSRWPRPAPSRRWPRRPRRRTGTGSCWAATTRSGSGSPPTAARSWASRCPARTSPRPTTSAASAPSSTPCSPRAGRCRRPTPPAPGWPPPSARPRARSLPPSRDAPRRPGRARHARPAAPWAPIDAPGHVHTAAAVHRCSTDVVAEDDRIALFPPAHDGVPSEPGDVWQDARPPAAPRRPAAPAQADHRPGRARRWRVLVVARLPRASSSARLFADGGGPAHRRRQQRGRRQRRPAPEPADALPAAGRRRRGRRPASRSTTTCGDRDNAGRVSRVIDGNPRSGWNTFTYRQQFPALKPGVGIMVSFASAVQLSELTIQSPSPGTVVEIRSAPSSDAAHGHHPDRPRSRWATAPPRCRWPAASRSPTCWCGSPSWAVAGETHRDHRAADPASLEFRARRRLTVSATCSAERPRAGPARSTYSPRVSPRPAPTRSCSPPTGRATGARSASSPTGTRSELWASRCAPCTTPRTPPTSCRRRSWRPTGGPDSYRGEASVRTWLHRILVNACIDRIRHDRAAPTVPLADQRRPRRRAGTSPRRWPPGWPSGRPGRAAGRAAGGGRAGRRAGLAGGRGRRDARRPGGHGEEPVRPRPGPAGRAARAPAGGGR